MKINKRYYQKEVKTAIENNKQVFIFIDKNVLTEYETYTLNKNNTSINYKYADSPNIYKFIDEIKSLTRNNNIKGFETVSDITNYLREQFAGLFKQSIIERERTAEQVIIQDIKDTAKVLHDLVEYLKVENVGQQDVINKIIRVNHPLVTKLKSVLGIKFNFFIDGISDLSELLKARNYRRTNDNNPYVWYKKSDNIETTILISEELFENGKLIYINSSEWKDSMLTIEQKEYIKYNVFSDDDLPF